MIYIICIIYIQYINKYIYAQGIFPYDIHDDIVYIVLMIQI